MRSPCESSYFSGLLPELLLEHAENLPWPARTDYLVSRGWRVSLGYLVSPHDGARYGDTVVPTAAEMLSEVNGEPAARHPPRDYRAVAALLSFAVGIALFRGDL